MRFTIAVPAIAAIASFVSAACNPVSFDYKPTFDIIGGHTKCTIEYVMWGPSNYHEVKTIQGTDLFKKTTYKSNDGQWQVTDDAPCTVNRGKLTVQWGQNKNVFDKTKPQSISNGQSIFFGCL
ncbi:hypothetical protein BGZ96_002761 [Linnemannia gamsii]|uniref:Uncharacterized protein n=1 Tax=Linnemannia gamsii TaxID=64522 RepID=A0ABQ7JK57_9FUNG|nr:hypothetical protein BGZ96_002761 [Linnemannia gamsii]